MKEEVLSLRNIIHPATESPGKKFFYLFFLDPRGRNPVMMERTRFLSPNVTPSTVVWEVEGYQRLPLFWIYESDFLESIQYSEWAKDFERKVVLDACFAFPDYEECKANRKGKRRQTIRLEP